MAQILSRSEKAFQVLNNASMVLLIGITLYPFWYVLILSINNPSDTAFGGVYFWPRRFTLVNYFLILQDGAVLRTFLLSVARIAAHVPSHLLVTGMAAYALSRKEFRIRKPFITLFFITLLFSGGLIPTYLLINDLRLLNTFWVYVLPHLFLAWNFVIIKTVMQTSIPESLIEAALIDGANHFFIFKKIVVPLSTAVLATIGLFQAVNHWNDWFWGAYYVFDDHLIPLQTYLQRLIRQSYMTQQELAYMADNAMEIDLIITPKSLTMAAVIVATGPIILVYPWIQKYFMKGIRLGSIKG